MRISELLNATINKNKRMFIPESHDAGTKKSGVTFYNEETEKLMESYEGNPFKTSRNTIANVFKETSNKTGINITTQTLRSIFAHEMGLRQMSDRYIDAFCVRVPANILAKHYFDFSPDVLKKIYYKADLKIFNDILNIV